MAKIWYVFMDEDPFDVKSYRRVEVKPGFLCGDRVCAIKAPDNGMYPAAPLSENLQKYIREGMVRGMFQPEFPINAKPYVYFKDISRN